jgi:hypothetical protein
VAEGRQVIVIVITIIIIITITSANMGTFKLVLVGILALTFMVFVTFFGRLPALRNTPIAGLHKLIWIHIPNATMAVDQRLTSGRISRSVKRSFNFMMYDRHPTVVVSRHQARSFGHPLSGPWPVLIMDARSCSS